MRPAKQDKQFSTDNLADNSPASKEKLTKEKQP